MISRDPVKRSKRSPSGEVGRALLLRYLFLAAATAVLLVFLEWLFQATKPSFLSNSSATSKLVTLGGATAVVLGAAGLATLVPAALEAYTTSGPWRRRFRSVALLVPTCLLGATAFLLIDNFTTTVLGFGVRDADRASRWAYVLLLALLLTGSWRKADRWERGWLRLHPGTVAVILGLLLAVAAFGAIAAFATAAPEPSGLVSALEAGADRAPNILILGTDGLDADHLSLYGYSRPTTPFLERFAEESLRFDNAFPNAAHTGASVISILTGKLPTQTRLIYPPDALHGADAYESLPGLLRLRGYRTFQSSLRYYADAYDLNLRAAFDVANGRDLSRLRGMGAIARALGDGPALLLDRIRDRLTRRLLQLKSPGAILDPYLEVTAQDSTHWVKDRERLESLLQFIDRSPAPFFAHVHLMGTHGPRFPISDPVFSQGQEQNQDWMMDFYDDAILRFDRLFEGLYGELERRGLVEETIVVVYSDHGRGYTTFKQVPLLMRFPHQAHKGRVQRNVQNLDIAATLLDGVGLERPAWVGGSSLLSTGDPCRPILAARVNGKIVVAGEKSFEALPKPPLYSLGAVTVTVCDRHFEVSFVDGTVRERRVPGHSGDCGSCDPPDPATVENFVISHLRENGYAIPPAEARRHGAANRSTRQARIRSAKPKAGS